MKQKIRRILVVLFGSSLLAIALLAVAAFTLGSIRQPGPIDIDEATTDITEPILPDGRVDYLTALNQRAREGVTVGDNAFVPLLKTYPLQPGGWNSPDNRPRRATYDALGLPSHGEQDVTLVPLRFTSTLLPDRLRRLHPDASSEFLNTMREAMEFQAERASQRPWTGDEFPELSEWIRLNDPVLPIIRDAARRPRAYGPWVTLLPEQEVLSMIDCSSILPTVLADYTELLHLRVLRAIGEGRSEEAAEDLITLFELTGLFGREACTTMEWFSMAKDFQQATGTLLYLMETDRLPARAWLTLRDRLRKIPPPRRIATMIDAGQRWVVLQIAMHLPHASAEEFDAVLLLYFNGSSAGFAEVLSRTTQAVGIDRNRLLREINSRYDRYVEFMRDPEPADWKRISDELRLGRPQPTISALTRQMAATFSPRTGLTNYLRDFLIGVWTPALGQLARSEQDWLAGRHLLDIALSLKAHRVEHGHYPETLRHLERDILDISTIENVSERTLRYERTETGFRLWTTGSNGIDDSGIDPDMGEWVFDEDDFGIEVPFTTVQN